jgi:hypothetical protein
MYAQYHGPDPEGLRQLKATALAAPLPPSGFTIASAADIEQQKQADLESKNPELALWLRIKAALLAPNGEGYFTSELKDAAVPPLVATLVEAKPVCRPTELTVTLSQPADTPREVVLTMPKPLTGKPEPGQTFKFEGIPTAFTKEPFLLKMNVEPERIAGLKPAPCKR